jgi:hypothetical protein
MHFDLIISGKLCRLLYRTKWYFIFILTENKIKDLHDNFYKNIEIHKIQENIPYIITKNQNITTYVGDTIVT